MNFRSVRVLRRAIRSILEREGNRGRIEILVANNDQSESWAVRSLEREFPVKIFAFGKNIGFGSAINRISVFARGEILGFLNPDTEFLSGDIGFPGEFMHTYRNVGILGAQLVSSTGIPEEWSAGHEITLWQIIRNNFGFPTGKRIWESHKETLSGFVSGAALFVRRDLFRRLGGFDERYFLYFEDADLCLRARQSGFETVFFPRLAFRHDGGVSHTSRQSQKKEYYRSQERYFLKHRPRWEYLILRTLNKLWM